MNTSRKHTALIGAGLLISLFAGSPVWADDVELLLSTPSSSNVGAKPNILFIIDSSGSMTRTESSQQPYDASETYEDGPCDTDMYYWSTNSNIPDCDDSNQKFARAAFQCAQGVIQAAASGSYTDTMAMYRKIKKDKKRYQWFTLTDKENLAPVECKGDSGVHGSNAASTPNVYARSGKDDPKYTSDPDREVSWSSWPTNQHITVFDSNYLNWYYNPPVTSARRTDTVKAVTKNVLGSLNNANVGFMRFHNSQGGPVIHALKDLDSNRAAVDAVIDGIPADGWTPLSETLYEAALYYRGMGNQYGGLSSTDSAAWKTTDPLVYKQPVEYSCSKNFIVLLTDGLPTEDRDAYSKVPGLPNYKDVMGGATACTGGNVDGACLDDVAEYLSKEDINPNIDGVQSVTTYTIGFAADFPLLKKTAEVSGGEYYVASDVTSLTAALSDILTNIFDRDISFTAPAVAVNAFNRTQHLNDLYVPVFRASNEVHWPGNVKKYTIKDSQIRDANDKNAIDPDSGFFAESARNFWAEGTAADGADVFKGGVANILPDPSTRNIYTNKIAGDLTVAGNSLSTANVASFALADFGLIGDPGEPTILQVLNWARGVDVKDEDNDPDTLTRGAMGDTLHSQPATVVYGETSGVNDIVLYTATNDGYLHAIDANSGEELWSFIPHDLLANLGALYINEKVDYKTYGIDGDVVPIVGDLNHDGTIDPTSEFVYIAFGLRRGGNKYYMLDVTDQDKPSLKWVKTFPELGQTWSAPVVTKVKIDSTNVTSAQDAVLVFGAGYDTNHDSPAHPTSADTDGVGIFMVDVETGYPLWRAGPDSFAQLPLTSMTRAIASKVSVIDLNGDSYADRMYASDLGGQILRFDINNGATPTNLVAGGVIAQLGAEGLTTPTAADTRRFYTKPDIAMFTDPKQQRRYLAINIGSGYRAHPLNNNAADILFSLRDPHVFEKLTQAQYNAYPIMKPGDLVEVAGKTETVIPNTADGWKLTLPPSQKVLSDARTFDDSVYFVTFEPQASSTDPCKAGLSVNRVYRMNVVNGDPSFGPDVSVDSAAADIDAARIYELEQVGIAPVPVFLFPSAWDPDCVGEECNPPPLFCVGVECDDPGFDNRPVRTLWTQDGIE